MTHYEIVQKLIGPVSPLGDSSRDDQRFENLKHLCELVEKLFTDIGQIAAIESHEHSVNRAAKFAKNFVECYQNDSNP
jgi:hypothetical protein